MITRLWATTCDEGEMSEFDRDFLWCRQFFNDYAFEGYVDGVPRL